MADEAIDDHLDWIRERLAAGGVDPATSPETIDRIIDDAIDMLSGPMSVPEREDLARSLQAAIVGLGPLQPLLDDPSVEEIWLNSPSRVFVARNGVPELTTVILSDQEVRDLVERMLHHSGRRLDLSSPFVDAMLSGGERLHAVIPPVTAGHWSV
ncbi:MAG: CpaF family protein, partial [Schaalia hyovaginalis]|nr:CpaF family protein [Schaalia hyovaginalis]